MDFKSLQDKYFNLLLQDASLLFVILFMLSKEEQEFVKYWEQNRNKQKRFFKQIAIGLPFGVLFALAMFLNFSSGWDKRVLEITKTYPSFKSLVIVLMPRLSAPARHAAPSARAGGA